ncbi:uncharacterized protein RJT21DRAFT_128472 [Scheffersomyces amazonensis]|uniref:uncharacterized protein n=1 Tax=Scheffersomyces amazonensis TaxID=1078765 RepID=UPI00315CEC86
MSTFLKINHFEVLLTSSDNYGFIKVFSLRIFGNDQKGHMLEPIQKAELNRNILGFLNYLLIKRVNYHIVKDLPRIDQIKNLSLARYHQLRHRKLSSKGFCSIQKMNTESLDVGYNKINTLNIDHLSPNLLVLDLNHNPLSKIKIKNQSEWPSLLTYLDLSNNKLKERVIAKIQWPNSILYLNLDNSRITSLKTLKTLPENLRYLSLNSCPIKTIYNKDKSDKNYLNYKLPSELIQLNLNVIGKCPQIGQNKGLKIELPAKLMGLSITAPRWKSLRWIKFPSTLLILKLYKVELDTSSSSFASEISDISNLQQLKITVTRD